jgi:hypothetical protein
MRNGYAEISLPTLNLSAVLADLKNMAAGAALKHRSSTVVPLLIIFGGCGVGGIVEEQLIAVGIIDHQQAVAP